MLKVSLLQFALLAVVVAVAALWFGAHSAWSVVFGGLSVLIPNFLFILLLKRAIAVVDRNLTMVLLLVAEFVKVVVTIGIMFTFATQQIYEVSWPWLIVGLIVAIKANLFAHMLKK